MSHITFQCYACGQVLKVGADKAGRKAKCNKCTTVLTIPVQSTVESGQHQASPQPQAPQTQVPYPQQFQQPQQDPHQQQYQAPQQEYQPPPQQDGYQAPPQGYPPPQQDGYQQPQQGYPPQNTPYPPQQMPPGQGYDDQPIQAEDPWDEGDYPRQKRAPGQPMFTHSFTRLGMLLVFIGACVYAGALALFLIGHLLSTISLISMSGNSAVSVLMGLGEVLLVLGLVGSIVGYVFCMLGPSYGNSFGMCIAVIAVAGVDMLLRLIFNVPFYFGGMMVHSGNFVGLWIALLLVHLLFSAELILVPLIYRDYCLGLRMKKNAKSTFTLIGISGAFAGVGLLYFIFWLVLANNYSDAVKWIYIILMWATAGVLVGFLIMYTLFLWRVRERIPER